MTGKADAVRAVSQQFKDRTNAVIEGVMAHLNDANAKELLGPGLSPLLGRGTLRGLVTFAIYADVLRMVRDMVMADGEISDEEVQESLGLLSVVAAGFAKVRSKEYAAFTELSPETAPQFLSRYGSDGGLFGHTNEATQWSGVELCRTILTKCNDCGPLDVFGDSLLAWANTLAASDATSESEHDVLDSIQSITKRPGRILTKAIAEQYLTDPFSVSLKAFEKLEDNAAALLASSDKELPLDGLETISAVAAEALIPHKGGLSVKGLAKLSLPAAHALAQYAGLLRNLNLGGFVDQPPVFAALRRHPSLVAKVIHDESMPKILKTKDIDKEDEYEFDWADAISKELHDEEYYGDPMDDGIKLLDKAAGRPVWSIPLASVKDSWVCENAEAYTVYFIGDRDKVIQRLKGLPPRILTAEIAEEYLEQEVSDFTEYGDITVEAARILGATYDWASGDGLDLSGLSRISREVADALSQKRPEDHEEDSIPVLGLCGLESLPDDVAQAIGQRYWSMSLGVPAISPKAAASLCGIYFLELNAIYDVSPDVAKSLCGGLLPGGLVISVPQLSAKTAEALAAREGPLELAVPTIEAEVAKELAKHRGVLTLRVERLSDDAARELTSHGGELRLYS
jgi:hypothetical protein